MASSCWTLEEALKLVRALQPGTREFGYHLALGGGVLNNGVSEKDVDLYFLPLDNQPPIRPDKLVEWLEGLWGKGENLCKEYADEEAGDAFIEANIQPPLEPPLFPPLPVIWCRVQPVSAYKHKLKFERGDGRIDVFIL